MADFQETLKRFVSAQKNTIKYANLCAQLALTHYQHSGDSVYCQQFYDAMQSNFMRRVAFVKWLQAHAPIIFDAGKFTKDKAEDAQGWDVDKALAVSFWDFAPDPEEIHYGQGDVVKAISGLANRYLKDNYTANDEEAEAVVAKLQKFANDLAA